MKEKVEISDYKTKIFFIVKNIMLKTKKTIIDCKKLFATYIIFSRRNRKRINKWKHWQVIYISISKS